MLKKFAVKGYRGFKDWTVLDLSQIRDYRFAEDNVRAGIADNVLLIGRNASGKTSFGTALVDIKWNFAPSLPGPLVDPIYLNADRGEGLAHFEYLFQFGPDEVSYGYAKSSVNKVESEHLELNGRLVLEIRSGRVGAPQGDLSLIGAENLNWELNGGYLSAVSYVTSNVPKSRLGAVGMLRDFAMNMSVVGFDRRTVEGFSMILDGIVESHEVDHLAEFLCRFGIREPLVEREMPDGHSVLYVRHEVRDIPFSRACSNGTKTLVRLFHRLELGEKPKLLFLDEFDACCHFELAEELLRYFGESDSCQFVSATHNTSLLKNGIMRPDCIYNFTRTGELRQLSSLTDRELRVAHNIEKLYRNGEFDE